MSKLEDRLAASLKIGGNAETKAGTRKSSQAKPRSDKSAAANAATTLTMTSAEPTPPPAQPAQVTRPRELHPDRVWPD